MAKQQSYQNYLVESLKDSTEATAYLNAALKGGDPCVFLVALRNVVKAQGGVAALAEKTQKGRTSMYKTLSGSGNPYFKNVNEILRAMGMQITIELDQNN